MQYSACEQKGFFRTFVGVFLWTWLSGYDCLLSYHTPLSHLVPYLLKTDLMLSNWLWCRYIYITFSTVSSNKLQSPIFWHVIAGKRHNSIIKSILHAVYRNDIISEYALTCSFPSQVQTPVRNVTSHEQWINKWLLGSKFQEKCREELNGFHNIYIMRKLCDNHGLPNKAI